MKVKRSMDPEMKNCNCDHCTGREPPDEDEDEIEEDRMFEDDFDDRDYDPYD